MTTVDDLVGVPQEVQVARSRRRLRVPDLLEERGLTVLDLVQRPEFLLPPSTAYRLARPDVRIHSVGLEILERLSHGFGIPVSDLWVWEDDGS
jgi:hypothetical protein